MVDVTQKAPNDKEMTSPTAHTYVLKTFSLISSLGSPESIEQGKPLVPNR